MKRLILGGAVAASLSLGLAGTPAHASTPSRSAQLIQATNTFGAWSTYYARNATTPPNKVMPPSYVNAQIARFIAPSYAHRQGAALVGTLTGDLHLMNIPSGYSFRIDRIDGTRATETIHWLFGTNPHTPIDRLTWAYTPTGWKITKAVYLRDS